jgi:hypothetical protein
MELENSLNSIHLSCKPSALASPKEKANAESPVVSGCVPGLLIIIFSRLIYFGEVYGISFPKLFRGSLWLFIFLSYLFKKEGVIRVLNLGPYFYLFPSSTSKPISSSLYISGNSMAFNISGNSMAFNISGKFIGFRK